MNKRVVLISIVCILLAIAGISILAGGKNDGNRNDVQKSMSSIDAIAQIEAELSSALKISNGISPDTYATLDARLTDLEKAGADTSNARTLLSRFEIGGGASKPAEQKTVTQTVAVQKTTTSAPAVQKTAPNTAAVQKTAPASSTAPVQEPKPEISAFITWEYTNDAWVPSKSPPTCPELLLESPVDVSKATSVLYPGQMRGPSIQDYKAHGGFRFDNSTGQDVEVRSPLDGYVWRGARYLMNGEIQYGFDIVDECGILHRFGHLYELSPKFQNFAAVMRPAVEGDSRTTVLSPYQRVSKGELIAVKVGIPGNAGMDWGVFDLRAENEASKSASFREDHFFQRWYDYHGLCWLDLLSSDEKALVKSLPGADGVMGKTSDYCK